MEARSAHTEPAVLAAVKRDLFPADRPGRSYAVTDTQFAADEWLPGRPVPDEVRAALAPFNRVRIGSGYPDLVGVGQPDDGFLQGRTPTGSPPLIVVEAKGAVGSRPVDVGGGLVQAHDRLVEANAAFVAAPATAVSAADRAMARELNVGLLEVASAGTVEPVVAPRTVGARGSGSADAIRFKASTSGVTDRSFGLNHPKNYVAYPLALHHPGETRARLEAHVVGAVDAAAKGAAFLNLIDLRPDGPALTPMGEEVVRFGLATHGSIEEALSSFEALRGSRRRFVDAAPGWGRLTRWITMSYPATRVIVVALQSLHDDGHASPSLVDLVRRLFDRRPTFAVELFVRGTEVARARVLEDDGGLRPAALTDGSVYHAPTVFQLKAILFHAGVLTERGAEPHRLEPESDVWALREPL